MAKVVASYRKLQKEIGLLDGTESRMYVHKANALYKKVIDLNETSMPGLNCPFWDRFGHRVRECEHRRLVHSQAHANAS